MDSGYIYAVFPSLIQANGYMDELPENELNKLLEVRERDTFTYEDGCRVSFFDPKTTHFVYQLDVDYEPKNIAKEKEIKAKALAKLTAEERKVLNL